MSKTPEIEAQDRMLLKEAMRHLQKAIDITKDMAPPRFPTDHPIANLLRACAGIQVCLELMQRTDAIINEKKAE